MFLSAQSVDAILHLLGEQSDDRDDSVDTASGSFVVDAANYASFGLRHLDWMREEGMLGPLQCALNEND
jgi:hypothetical protein